MSISAAHKGFATDGPFTVRTSELANGLKIISQSRPEVRTVVTQVYLTYGPVYQPSIELVGLPHFVEHLALGSRATLKARRFAGLRLDTLGDANGFTFVDMLGLGAHTARGGWRSTLREFARGLREVRNLSERTIEIEREIVVNELHDAESADDDWHEAKFARLLWPRSTVAIHPLGRTKDVRKFTLDTVQSYLDEALVGSRMIIGVTGPVPHQKIVSEVVSHFGNLPRGTPLPKLSAKAGCGIQIVPKLSARQTYFSLGQGLHISGQSSAPSEWALAKDYMILRILAKVLGGLYSSDVYVFGQVHGYCYNVACGLDTSYPGLATLTLSGSGSATGLSAIADRYLKSLRRIARRGLSQSELRIAVSAINVHSRIESEDLRQRTVQGCSSLSRHGRYVGYATRQKSYTLLRNTVQPDEIKAIAKRLLATPALLLVSGRVSGFRPSKELVQFCGNP